MKQKLFLYGFIFSNMDNDNIHIPQRGRPRKTKEEETVSDMLRRSELEEKRDPNNDLRRGLGLDTYKPFEYHDEQIVLEPIVDDYGYKGYPGNQRNPLGINQNNNFMGVNHNFKMQNYNENYNYKFNNPNANGFMQERQNNPMLQMHHPMMERQNFHMDREMNFMQESQNNYAGERQNIHYAQEMPNQYEQSSPVTTNSLYGTYSPFMANQPNQFDKNNINFSQSNTNLIQNNEMTTFMPNKYSGTSLGQTLSHQSNAHSFDTDPNNVAYQNYSLWVNRKKRKNNPLLWQYINQSFVHPSKFSSVDYVQKRFLGTFTQPIVEKNNYQVLPLFLNSSSYSNEFESIAKLFLEKAAQICYDNITVMQLKNLMKEFGLCHNGKKTELIERVRLTVERIKNKLQKKKPVVEEKKEEENEEEFMYF